MTLILPQPDDYLAVTAADEAADPLYADNPVCCVLVSLLVTLRTARHDVC